MPTPWLSWPNRLARTRWSATSRASCSELPSARQIAMVKACKRSGLTRTSPTAPDPPAMSCFPPNATLFRRKIPCLPGAVNVPRPADPGRGRQPADRHVTETRMRGLFRLIFMGLLLAGTAGALAQTQPPPQRPFSQLVELWTRQLDRITYRADQPDVLASEIDALREQVSDVRDAAMA